jgi:hypothetical protein
VKRHALVILAAATIVGAAGLLYMSAATFGPGGRGFFSPDTLRSRTQAEYLIPLTQIPVYRGPYSESQWPIVDYLVAKGYWSAVNVAEPRWVSTSHENRQWRDGLSRFERELVGNDAEWRKWTEDHPELAKVVWPRVLAELRKPGVAHTNDADVLLLAARYATTPEEFERLLSE